jgi:NDP-sugar pyrophosphorylase family protein
MSLPVAILAGGLATRLRPVTETIPKALLSVDGEPFANHQLRLLAGKGIRKVVFLLGYLGESVVQAIGDGRQFGLDVDYAFDGPRLLGTGGAVAAALPKLGEAFFVLYGDSYLDCDYGRVADAFRDQKRQALMTVFRNEGRWDTSNVELRDGEIVTYSKSNRNPRMHHIDYGLGVFRKDVFAGISTEVATDLATLYEQVAARGELAACEVNERFYEVGSFTGLEELTQHIRWAKGL